MKKIEQKTNPRTIDEHFDQKYEELGISSRDAFEEKSQAFMIVELVKDARAMADMTRKDWRKNSTLTGSIFQKSKEQLVISESQRLKK